MKVNIWMMNSAKDMIYSEISARTLSLLLRTAAYCGGTRTIWCGIVLCRGNHTLAGRFKLSVLSSATNWTVLLSFVGIVPSNLPIDINAWINSNSGASRGAWIRNINFMHRSKCNIYFHIQYNSHCRNNLSFGLANRSPHLGRNRSRYNHCQTLDPSSGPQDLLYLLYLLRKIENTWYRRLNNLFKMISLRTLYNM